MLMRCWLQHVELLVLCGHLPIFRKQSGNGTTYMRLYDSIDSHSRQLLTTKTSNDGLHDLTSSTYQYNVITIPLNNIVAPLLKMAVETRRCGLFEFPFVNQAIHFDNYASDIKYVLSKVFPEKDLSGIFFTILTGGITNQVIWTRFPQHDGYIFRIYGRDTDKFIDREREIINNQTASVSGVGPGVVCVFDNGVALHYVPGSPMNRDDLSNWTKAEMIAKTMAKMHVCAVCPRNGDGPLLETTFFGSWLQLVPDELECESKTRRLREIKEEFGGFDRVTSDMLSMVKKVNSPVVFCHNDLLCGNILYNGSVNFIDLEYGGANYRGFDIADHFCEFAGIESPDFSLYPDKEFQYKWLRAYLQETARLKGEDPGNIQDRDVDALYIEVNKFAPACHLMWGIWSLFQAKYSQINYNYLEYSHMRLTEYQKGLDFYKKHP